MPKYFILREGEKQKGSRREDANEIHPSESWFSFVSIFFTNKHLILNTD